MIKIDLGCGINKPQGYVGIDTIDIEGVDIVRDVEKRGLPFSDNSVTLIRANSFLEHLEDLIFVMNECWRVLKEDGYLVGKVPKAGSDAGFRDPTHKRFFVVNTFKYFDECNQRKYEMYKIKPWRITNVKVIDSRDEKGGLIQFEMQPYKK